LFWLYFDFYSLVNFSSFSGIRCYPASVVAVSSCFHACIPFNVFSTGLKLVLTAEAQDALVARIYFPLLLVFGVDFLTCSRFVLFVVFILPSLLLGVCFFVFALDCFVISRSSVLLHHQAIKNHHNNFQNYPSALI
jgi:hypothetical protein